MKKKQIVDIGVYFLKYDRIAEGEYFKDSEYFRDNVGKDFSILTSIDDLYDMDKYVAYNVMSSGELAKALCVDMISEDVLSDYNDDMINYFYVAIGSDIGHVGIFKFKVDSFKKLVDTMCETGEYKLLPFLNNVSKDKSSRFNDIVTFDRLSDDIFKVPDDECKSSILEIIDKRSCYVTLTEGRYHQIKRMRLVFRKKIFMNLERHTPGRVSLSIKLKRVVWNVTAALLFRPFITPVFRKWRILLQLR